MRLLRSLELRRRLLVEARATASLLEKQEVQ